MKTPKHVSADEAVSHIPSHCHVHLSSVASVPHCLIRALCRRADVGDVSDLHFHHFHTEGPAPTATPPTKESSSSRASSWARTSGRMSTGATPTISPVHLGESQKLYRDGCIKLGAALVNISLPDENGNVSLGTSVDCSVAAVESAELVIGVINPNVPFAYGDLLNLNQFDYLVSDDSPLVTADFAEPTPTEVLIGKNCAALVEDGDCTQMGIGALPNALAAQLSGHRHLGLHTEMFADGLLEADKERSHRRKPQEARHRQGGRLLPARLAECLLFHQQESGGEHARHKIHQQSLRDSAEPPHEGHQFSDGSRSHWADLRRFDRHAHLQRHRRAAGVRARRIHVGGRQKSITAFASRTKNGKNKIVAELNAGAG